MPSPVVNEQTKSALEALGVISPPKQAGAKAMLAYLSFGDINQAESSERLARIKQYQALIGRQVTLAHERRRRGELLYVTVHLSPIPYARAADSSLYASQYDIMGQVRWDGGPTTQHSIYSIMLATD
jgi:hypothetical protein